MLTRKKYTKKDFAWAHMTPSDISTGTKNAIQIKKDIYAKVKAVPDNERSFENTVLGIEKSDYDFTDFLSQLDLLKNVSPKKNVRSACEKAQQKLTDAFVEIEYDREMYEALVAYNPKEEKLKDHHKRLFDDMLRGYKRMGFELPLNKQRRLKSILKELTKLSIAFDKNVNGYRDHILVTKEELDGLPETFISNLSKDSKTKKYKVSLEYPDLAPFMASAHNAEKRQELSIKNSKKGGKQNLVYIKKMIALRHEIAKILGYPTYADYKTEERTAKNAKNVEKFLSSLLKKVEKEGKKELQELETLKRDRVGSRKARLEHYDVGYYFKALRKEKFDIDGNILKEYFPFQHVKKVTLDIYAKLFSLKFKHLKDLQLWHKDVELFEVQDKNGSTISYFALDLYPRKNKYGHAAAFETITGRRDGDQYISPMAVMVSNFPKPSKTNPSLMSHGEVETFFHEFGHVMHHISSTSEYASQSGFHVAWDFVEAPSQMLENWVWDKNTIKRLSKHYKTGKPLPTKMLNNIIKSKHFGEPFSVLTQLIYALYDYTLHTKHVADIHGFYETLQKKYTGIRIPKESLFPASFGHIAHGYDAGYYGYLWSKVYAQDMFSRFERGGVMNAKIGGDYRKWILEKGSSMDEIELVKKFLGRKPNNKAFLKSIGAKE